MSNPTGSPNFQMSPSSFPTESLTIVETSRKNRASDYLQLAKSYAARNDLANAVACCLEGLVVTFGISRPLMVRDQIEDLLELLDPEKQVRSRIRTCARSVATLPAKKRERARATDSLKFLERFVSVHQLLDYPSAYPRFNLAYVQAIKWLQSDGQSIGELYIVQYQGPKKAHASEDLCFTFVPSALISDTGPFYLTDICAVVRVRT